MAKKTNLQALSEAMGKIITAKNYVAWSKIKSFDEQEKFYNSLLCFYGFPCVAELRDELDAAFEYEHDMLEYEKRFVEDTPALDPPWWQQR